MGRTPDAYDGPRIDEAIIWEEQPSDPTEERTTQFVQNKGLLTLLHGVTRPIGETPNSIWQTEVDDVFVDTPPAGPITGYRLIVGPTPAGAFVGHEGEIAEWDGTAWWFTTPRQGTATMVRAVGVETPYVQSAMSLPWVWDKLNPGGYFGSELHYEVDNTPSTTSSTSWQTKLTLNTDPLPLGDYFGIAVAVVVGSVVGTEVASQLLFDGSDRGAVLVKPGVANGEASFTPFFIEANVSGSHTLSLQWRKAGGGGSATIRGTRIAWWRLK